jgi:hypothetical protein
MNLTFSHEEWTPEQRATASRLLAQAAGCLEALGRICPHITTATELAQEIDAALGHKAYLAARDAAIKAAA